REARGLADSCDNIPIYFFKQKTAYEIERATELARKMVCEFGMSDLGPLTFGKKEEQIFLGREIAQHRDYSEATAIKIDDEVRRLIGHGYNTAKGILGEHRDKLVRIAA